MEEQQKVEDALGLSIDMLAADRLREWARLILVHGADISHWGSPMFVASKMQIMATEIEKAVRDIGVLREHSSSLTRVEGEIERLNVLLAESRRAEYWAVIRECFECRMPFAVFSLASTMRCPTCQRLAMREELKAALQSSLTRLLEGGYTQHKADCPWRNRSPQPGGAIAGTRCTCDLDTLLATLTRLARSPEE